MSITKSHFHIIGGGISGLYCAKLLKQKYPDHKITLYEQNTHLGGRCYSYHDKDLDAVIDNATHVVIGANTNTAKLLKNEKFHKSLYFFDIKNQKLSKSILFNLNEIALAVFNNSLKNTPLKMIFKTLQKLFPFTKSKTKIWFSDNKLEEALIAPLSLSVDTIKTGYLLKSFEQKDNQISKLIFNKEKVSINENDVVISALDASNYSKIFKPIPFDFESIINIFYKTSTKLTLPENQDFIAIKNGLSQWVFSGNDILAVTISQASDVKLNNEDLAREVWKEVSLLRGRAAAFMPQYKVVHHKRSTIKQDKKNNELRPSSSQTNLKNLFICGDWTMKNYPSSIEASTLSAIRATKQI
jgi:uncharacterized protein with NAD-binding domain and iron-sulfur cluster